MKKHFVKMLAVCLLLCSLFAGTAAFAESSPKCSITGDYNDGSFVWVGEGRNALIEAPEGYVISTLEEGTFGESVSMSEEEWLASQTIYLKHSESGDVIAETLDSIRWDKQEPEGMLQLDGSDATWDMLTTHIGNFVQKDEAVFRLSYMDQESGIHAAEYYVSDQPLIFEEDGAAASLEAAIGGEWKSYMNPVAVKDPGMHVFYARITDNVGNVMYLNSDGILVCQASSVADTFLHYIKGSNRDVSTEVVLNGNTIAEIALDGQVLAAGAEYDVDAEGKLTFAGSFLEGIAAGEHTITVGYSPVGHTEYTGEGLDDSVLTLSVEDWGEAVEISGITHWIDETGTTSVEIQGHDFVWLRESAGGKDIWFGIECGYWQFDIGSRFWVRVLDPVDDAEAWAEAYAKMDEEMKQSVDGDKLLLFQIGVTSPEGEAYKEFYSQTVLQIQYDDSWSGPNPEVFYCTDGTDESFEEGLVTGEYPEGYDTFIMTHIGHFSCYGAFDSLTEDELEENQKPGDVNDGVEVLPDDGEDGGTGQPGEEGPSDRIPEPEEDGASDVEGPEADLEQDSDENEEESSPATGDQAMTLLWMGLAVAAAGLLVQLKRRNS